MRQLQRISRTEELMIIGMVEANGLNLSVLGCNMTRQYGEGTGMTPRGTPYDISYDLMLCEHCGNLEPQRLCPSKVGSLKKRLEAGE